MFESSESSLYGCLIHCDVGIVGLVFGFCVCFFVDLFSGGGGGGGGVGGWGFFGFFLLFKSGGGVCVCLYVCVFCGVYHYHHRRRRHHHLHGRRHHHLYASSEIELNVRGSSHGLGQGVYLLRVLLFFLCCCILVCECVCSRAVVHFTQYKYGY